MTVDLPRCGGEQRDGWIEFPHYAAYGRQNRFGRNHPRASPRAALGLYDISSGIQKADEPCSVRW